MYSPNDIHFPFWVVGPTHCDTYSCTRLDFTPHGVVKVVEVRENMLHKVLKERVGKFDA
jgi:hypothetical protein